MKSIRTKILVLILGCVVISTATIVFVNVLNAGKRLDEDSFRILQLECSERQQLINEVLLSVEQGVNTIYEYAVSIMPEGDQVWENEELRDEYLEKVKEVALIAAENTEGAVAVYYRFAPELVKDNALGTFMVKDDEGIFMPHEITDLSMYDKDDIEHVGWYYIPLSKGKPTWTEPYVNKNVDIYMISYVIPVYRDGKTIGVVGMDIEMPLIHEKVDSVKVYDTGYAFLMNHSGEIINHDDCPHGTIKEEVAGDMDKVKKQVLLSAENSEVVPYKWAGEDKYLVAQQLVNGMYFTVCVPAREIDAPRVDMIRYSVLSVVIILAFFLLLTALFTSALVRPLKKLTANAERVAASDFDVDFSCKSKDEIGVLTDSIHKMVDSLKENLDQINNMAYYDALTGLKSNAAYSKIIDELDKQIKGSRAEFSIYVMDMNNLKKMNDTYGHKMGDTMLCDAADIMRKVWDEDSIYRVGGDEFAVILQNSVASQYQDDIKTFDGEVDKFNKANDKYDIEIQIAIGMAVYNKGRDDNFNDVFRRADNFMYEDKARKKHL